MNKMISARLTKRTSIVAALSCILTLSALIYSICCFTKYADMRDIHEFMCTGVYSAVILAEILLLTLIILEIRKTGKPFSKKIVAKLRIMAGVLIAGGFMPFYASTRPDETTKILYVSFDARNILIISIGILIAVLSEVFVYGLRLQEDNDMIA